MTPADRDELLLSMAHAILVMMRNVPAGAEDWQDAERRIEEALEVEGL